MAEPENTQLQEFLDALPVVFFHKDMENRFVGANEAAADALGTTVEALTGTHAAQWFPQEAAAYHADDLEVIRTGRPKVGSVEEVPTEGNKKRWIRVDKHPHRGATGVIDGILVFIQDATAEARALDALRRSEERLKTIIASEPECVKIVAADGTITEMNPAGLALLAASGLGDVLGTSIYDWLLPEHHESFASLHDVVTAGGSGILDYEIRDLAGENHWIETHAVPLVGSDEGFLSISRDITERRLADQQREEFERQISRAQRLEGIGVVAAGVAHDFNNSLMAIMGNIELAASHLAEGSPARDHLDSSIEAAQQVAVMCDQLLTYAGKRNLSLRPADLSELIGGIRDLLRVSIAPEATLRFDLASSLPTVEVDETQIDQVLVSLVTNASDALEGRPGEITISTGVADYDAEALALWGEASALEPGQYVQVRVADTGRGMTETVREQIFEPFFTTKITGSGLGLPTTLGVIRGHGGAVQINSVPGDGTTVELLLPASGADIVVTAQAEATRVVETPGGTILLVDDDNNIRDLLRTVLERAGYAVLAAADGESAVELLAQQSEPVVAAVLDITMPGMNGAETYVELERRQPDLPVIFSSGYPEKVAIDPLIAVSHVEFIQKPYVGADLLRRLATLIDRSSTSTG